MLPAVVLVRRCQPAGSDTQRGPLPDQGVNIWIFCCWKSNQNSATVVWDSAIVVVKAYVRQCMPSCTDRKKTSNLPIQSKYSLSCLKLLRVFMLCRCSGHYQMRSVDWVKDVWLIVKVLSFTWLADQCWNISRVCSFCDCHAVNIVILKYCLTVNIGRESVHCMESFHLRWWIVHFAKLLLQNFVTKPTNNLSLHVCRFRPS